MFYIYSSEKCFILITHLVQIAEIHSLPPPGFDHMDTGRAVKSSKDLSLRILPANYFSVHPAHMEGSLKRRLFFAAAHLLFLALLCFLMIQRIDTVANLLHVESC